MKRVNFLLLLLFFSFSLFSQNEDKEDKEDKEEAITDSPKEEDVEKAYLALENEEVKILYSLLKELKGEFNFNSETFFTSEEVTPNMMIELLERAHVLIKRSYAYAQKYKRQCKIMTLRELTKLKEREITWEKQVWTDDELTYLNQRLNIIAEELDKEKEKIREKELKARKKRREKKLRKIEKEGGYGLERKKVVLKEKEPKVYVSRDIVTFVENNNLKNETDKEIIKTTTYLKVSEPIFSEKKRIAMIFVEEYKKEALKDYEEEEDEVKEVTLKKYVVVLKKRIGGWWCIKGKVDSGKIFK